MSKKKLPPSQILISPLRTSSNNFEASYKTGILLRISLQDTDGIFQPQLLSCLISLNLETTIEHRISLANNKQQVAVFLTPEDNLKLSFEASNLLIGCRFLPYSFFINLQNNSTYKWIKIQEDVAKQNGNKINQQNILMFFERVPFLRTTPKSMSPFKLNSTEKYLSSTQSQTPQQQNFSQNSHSINKDDRNNQLFKLRATTPQSKRKENHFQPISDSKKLKSFTKQSTPQQPLAPTEQIVSELFLDAYNQYRNSEYDSQKGNQGTQVTPIKKEIDSSSINSELRRPLQNQVHESSSSSIHDIFLPEFTPIKGFQAVGVPVNSYYQGNVTHQSSQQALNNSVHYFNEAYSQRTPTKYNPKEANQREQSNENLRMMINDLQVNQRRIKQTENQKQSQLNSLMTESYQILRQTEEIEESIQTLWQREHALEKSIENIQEANSLIEADINKIICVIEQMRNFRLGSQSMEDYENSFKFQDFKTAEMSQIYSQIYESKLGQLQVESTRDQLQEKQQKQEKLKLGFSRYRKVLPQTNMNAKIYMEVLKSKNNKPQTTQLVIGKNLTGKTENSFQDISSNNKSFTLEK